MFSSLSRFQLPSRNMAPCSEKKAVPGEVSDQDHYSEISIGNASGSDGKIYGVPKDKDNILLVYNKEMFDQAGLEYPNDNWTWDDMESASQAIYDKTGKYGYMAYNDEQLGYWNFVYQNGGYILDSGMVLLSAAASSLVQYSLQLVTWTSITTSGFFAV